MPHESLRHTYRDLFVTRLNSEGYVNLDYKIRTADPIDVAEAAVRMLLILTRRSLYNLKEPEKYITTQRYGAVQSAHTLRGHSADVRLALPVHLIDLDDPFTGIVLYASSVTEYSYCRDVWLEDIELPQVVLDNISGPRYGIDGIRSRLAVNDRPLLAAIIPPQYNDDKVALVSYVDSAFRGGADLVVDDILAVFHDVRLEERISLIQELVDKHNSRALGMLPRVGYLTNCTALGKTGHRILRQARQCGVMGIIVNAHVMSFSWLHEHVQDGIFGDYHPVVVSTNMGSSMLGRSPMEEISGHAGSQDASGIRTGISEAVTAKLSRLAGADAVHTGTVGAECWHPAEFNMTPRTLRDEMGRIKKSMCVAEGDVRISEIGTNVQYLSQDVIMEVSSGMLSHPGGVELSASAYRKVCEVVSHRMTEREYEALLLLLARKYKHVEAVLKEERWAPRQIAADQANLSGIVERAGWFDARRRRSL